MTGAETVVLWDRKEKSKGLRAFLEMLVLWRAEDMSSQEDSEDDDSESLLSEGVFVPLNLRTSFPLGPPDDQVLEGRAPRVLEGPPNRDCEPNPLSFFEAVLNPMVMWRIVVTFRVGREERNSGGSR